MAGELIINIAIENNNGKTTPVAASSWIFLLLINNSINQDVKTPVAVAASTTSGELISLTNKNPTTIPNKTVWEIASINIDIFLNTKNKPIIDEAIAVDVYKRQPLT